jgi:hypothetical protein
VWAVTDHCRDAGIPFIFPMVENTGAGNRGHVGATAGNQNNYMSHEAIMTKHWLVTFVCSKIARSC